MIPSGERATGEEENATVVFLTTEKDLELPTQAKACNRGFLPLNHHFTADMRRWLIPKVAEAGIDLLRIRRIRVYDYREGKNTSLKGEKNVNPQHTGRDFFPSLFEEPLSGC